MVQLLLWHWLTDDYSVIFYANMGEWEWCFFGRSVFAP